MQSAVEKVVSGGFCTGCGLCSSLGGGMKIEMRMNAEGYLRPISRLRLTSAEEREFRETCPGVKLDLKLGDAPVDLLWGPLVKARVGWSSDPQIRFVGSSGGAISSLLAFMIDEHLIDFAVHVVPSATEPLKNIRTMSRTREEVIRGAGSRYAPSATLERLWEVFSNEGTFAFVGKPCEIAGLRSYLRRHPALASRVFATISFMCAGVPSARGTQQVIDALGAREEEIVEFRYRGNGWPGLTTATTREGDTFSMKYERAWGEILGRHLQLRCKICPDGTGEFADIVCADAWHGARGYPEFDERDGRSLVLTRNELGERIVRAAETSGALVLTRICSSEIARMQPYQATRKKAAIGRIAALSIYSGLFPRFRGLRLLGAMGSTGVRNAFRNFAGTFMRLLRGEVR